jgi:hypothetical protein
MTKSLKQLIDDARDLCREQADRGGQTDPMIAEVLWIMDAIDEEMGQLRQRVAQLEGYTGIAAKIALEAK